MSLLANVHGLPASTGRATSTTLPLTVWALALLLLQLAGLGGVPLFDVDEGAFAEATREMLASGDWGHTTLQGEDRWDKPILSYWLQALSVGLFGLDEFALRLPSALASWLWAVVVAHRVSQQHDAVTGVVAGTLLSTSLGVMLIGRAATADALLNLWLTLATLSLWTALQHLAPQADAARQHIGRQALRRAALWIALGLLTKGPVALLVPGATVLLWCLTVDADADAEADARATANPGRSGSRGLSGRLARPWSRLRPLLGDAPAWGVLVLVALPWYAYALHRHGMAFVDGFLWRHNLQRYGGTLEGHAGAWFYYLLLLPVLMLPWPALLLPLLARVRSLWRDPSDRFLLLWAGFVLVFFSASGTKLPHYALYGLTPLVMLAARALAAPAAGSALAVTGHGLADRVGRVLLVASLALLPLAALWCSDLAQSAIAASKRPADALHALLLAGPGLLDGEPGRQRLVAATLIGVVLGACAWLGLRSPDRSLRRVAVPLLGACVLWLGLTQVLLPWWAERLQGPVVTLARVARLARAEHPQTEVVQWGLHQPSFALYLGRPTPRRAPLPGELALVRIDRLDTLRLDDADLGARDLPVRARASGYLLIERPASEGPR